MKTRLIVQPLVFSPRNCKNAVTKVCITSIVFGDGCMVPSVGSGLNRKPPTHAMKLTGQVLLDADKLTAL